MNSETSTSCSVHFSRTYQPRVGNFVFPTGVVGVRTAADMWSNKCNGGYVAWVSSVKKIYKFEKKKIPNNNTKYLFFVLLFFFSFLSPGFLVRGERARSRQLPRARGRRLRMRARRLTGSANGETCAAALRSLRRYPVARPTAYASLSAVSGFALTPWIPRLPRTR